MPRTMQQILDQADELAAQFESYEPDPADHRDPAPVLAMREAIKTRAAAEAALTAAIAAARSAGYSWATVGTIIGTSGEAARQRYGQLVGCQPRQ